MVALLDRADATILVGRVEQTFETGLALTARWYIDRPDWRRPLQDRHQQQRLGLKA